MQTYLVVANRTLGGAELLDAVRQRMERGPATFWVLVPAVSTGHLINDFNALSAAFPVDPGLLPSPADLTSAEDDVREATARLAAGLRRLRSIGATAEGAVGNRDPLKAVTAVLATRSFDEILLSTLPSGLSRWLAQDLPRRIRRRTDVPLTVCTAGRDDSDDAPPPPSAQPA